MENILRFLTDNGHPLALLGLLLLISAVVSPIETKWFNMNLSVLQRSLVGGLGGLALLLSILPYIQRAQSDHSVSGPAIQPSQKWLVIDRVNFPSAPEPVRVVADIGGHLYSYPSSQLTVGGTQLPERFALPIGLQPPKVTLTILRSRPEGGVDRIVSAPIQVNDYSDYSSQRQVEKWHLDANEHLANLSAMTVVFHFE